MSQPEAEWPCPAFVSLGMVVLDELRFPKNPTLQDVVGGSGAYSVLGARLAAGIDRRKEIGCFVFAGHDFPQSVLDTFESWGVQLSVQRDPARCSTRGLLEYEDDVFGRKTFRYTTPPLQPSPGDLAQNLLGSTAFHLLSRPDQLQTQVDSLAQLRAPTWSTSRPLIVWEPTPPFCTPDQKAAHLEACKLVDVFSPNHIELTKLLGETASAQNSPMSLQAMETYAQTVLDSGVGPLGKGSVVVRAGEHGCLVASASGRHAWLPPFYSTDEAIVDATGAGNTFLGALTYAMSSLGKDVFEAAELASVMTSYSLEQIGLPKLMTSECGRERWNGSEVSARVSDYKERLNTAKIGGRGRFHNTD